MPIQNPLKRCLGSTLIASGMGSLMPLTVTLTMTVATTACVHSVESDIKVTPCPQEDKDYAAALAKATKSRTVFKDFETRFHVSATYLSPEFRNAFSKRLERVYMEDQVRFAEADSKAGFLVSLNAPDSDRTDLSNPEHWSVLLATGQGAPLKPVLIKRIDDKERWRAFFDSINEWTEDYLVVFDAPAVDPNSPELVAKSGMTLKLANADAQVDLSW